MGDRSYRTTARKPRPKYQAPPNRVVPASGRCRWVGKNDEAGLRWLEITVDDLAVVYMVERVPGGYNLYLVRRDNYTLQTYHVRRSMGVLSCNCPDATHRRQHACKHCMAISAANARDPF